MMPTSCRSMDSYPYQRNQIQFPPYYYPNIEANPPQMKMELPKPPFPYEQPWTFAGNYGHPMNFCCGHNNFPGCYSYRPSYHYHAPVPSPMYYTAAAGGGYPAYGEPFFVPYSPQPHYTMEIPRYEYDKYMPRDYHCCRCPNHQCHRKDMKDAVKIEEEEPNARRRVNDDDALAPAQMRNYPYPIVWIPPESTSNKEAKNDPPIDDNRKPWSPRNLRADAEEPGVRWNGWIPFDMNCVPKTDHEGDGRRISTRNLQGENNRRESEDRRMNCESRSDQKRSEFPFPIIWMPCYNKQNEGNGRENINHNSNSSPKCIEEVADEGVTNGMRSNQVESTNSGGADVTKKVTNEKFIPVKEVESHQGKSEYEESGGKREKMIPVHKIEENVTKKDSHTGREKLSTSPRKNGKLPPVCLRVDPLPRKKNGNGNSRSPSPPASKERSKETVDGKAHLNSNGQNDPNISEKVKPKERTIAVSDSRTNDKAQQDFCPLNAPIIIEKVEPKESTIQVNENKTGDENNEAKEESSVLEKEESKAEKGVKIAAEEGGKEKKVLSGVDAAVLIQAAYRGYNVRKWEPLKKLKQIDEISKELTDVRGRVEALEHSSDLQNDEKQRFAIGETIMRLLLKLDTIQGLHSSFREIRKSLARELVSLQERLDSIMMMKPQKQTQELADTKPAEETPTMNMQNEECMQEQPEEEVEGVNHDTTEKCEDESQLLADSKPNDVSESESMVVEPEAKLEAAEDIPIEVDNSEANGWRELPVGLIDDDVTDHSSKKDEQNHHSTIMEHDSDIDLIKVLPLGVLDEDTATSESGKDEGSEVSEEQPQREDVESLLVELPVGVLDEDTEKPEHEYEEEAKNEVELANSATQDNDGDGCSTELMEGQDIAAELANSATQDNDGDECSKESMEEQDIAAEQENNANNEKTELSASASSTDAPKEFNGDKKVLEENEKLREMMKKLVEAGNEQMNVITDLTGRVKDLEKRLARSKKVRTKRFKPVKSKTSSRNNSPSHDRAISVAM